jgi:hypothetical protein
LAYSQGSHGLGLVHFAPKRDILILVTDATKSPTAGDGTAPTEKEVSLAEELLVPISFRSWAGREIVVTGLLNGSYVRCTIDGEPTSRPWNVLPREVREEIDAMTNGRRATMAAATKKRTTTKKETAAPAETRKEREARRAEREAEREAKLLERVEAIAERIREGLRDEEAGVVARLREDLEDLKPTAEIAARMKETHGLTYGRLEGKGAWRIPIAS